METLLVLNLGSTSFKYELFNAEDLATINKGQYDLQLTINRQQTTDNRQPSDELQEEVDRLFREVLRQAGDISELMAVGHRVVHGGDKFFATQKIKENEITELEQLNSLAPLHNPFNLAGIKAAFGYLPETPNFAVFDTGFFKDLPEAAKVYPIPYEYYEKGIHKFGFHGISHKFAAEEAAKEINKPLEKINVISVHLGGGASVSATHHGKPIDTSMGFTPMEGLMMATRPGDLDPGVIIQMLTDLLQMDTDTQINDAKTIIEKINYILNYESGVKGICGQTDYLELLKAATFDPRAKLAFDMFINRIKKYIGAYAALLGEVDALVFTGKIGAGKPETRKKICDKMGILKDVPVIVVEPHEELEIAREIASKNR
ncbi:MAG: acetate/propionate family kinase [Patescibacteria group bacterium]|nr:acetate/propionate family kinase [Patescibacteria group bacterium]